MSFISLDVVAFYDRVSDGLVFIAQRTARSCRTLPQLDQAVAALGHIRDILVECNEVNSKVVEEGHQDPGGDQFLLQLNNELTVIRKKLNVLLGQRKYGFKTAISARKIRSEAEALQRTAFGYSEGLKDKVIPDPSFLKSLSSMKINKPPSEPLEEGSNLVHSTTLQKGHNCLTAGSAFHPVEKEGQRISEDNSIPMAMPTHGASFMVPLLGILTIPNMMYPSTCPYCLTTFYALTEFKVHLEEAHKTINNGTQRVDLKEKDNPLGL